MSLTNQEALQNAQGTYSSTNNETKVISRRIISNADRPQIAANHRPDTSSKTCHTLRNSVRIANSARRCHIVQKDRYSSVTKCDTTVSNGGADSQSEHEKWV